MTSTPPGPVRAAIYARFSSHLQDPRSIDDQVRLCRAKLREIGVVSARVCCFADCLRSDLPDYFAS
ncbi:MAG: recombinase family protein, partial [Defluviicoccus sp.]|nr:recombinase family protein [Defluviicoccus sp.]MDE0279082.1 recombinase family protein [Defluviicoccus sp.]